MSAPRHLRLMVEDFDAAPQPAAPRRERCTCPRCTADPSGLRCHGETYAEGVHAGQQMRAEHDAAAATHLTQHIATALETAHSAATAIAEDTADALGQAVMAMLAAALPATMRHLGAREAASIANAILPSLAREPAVTIEVAPDAAVTVGLAVDALPPMQRARVTLHVDAHAEPGALRITWAGGALRHDPAAALTRVRAILADLGLTAPEPSSLTKEYVHG